MPCVLYTRGPFFPESIPSSTRLLTVLLILAILGFLEYTRSPVRRWVVWAILLLMVLLLILANFSL